MRKASGSRTDRVQDKKEKKNSARSLGNMEGKKGGNEVAKQRIDEKNRPKEARDVAREGAQARAMKSSFIHTVSSNYQCIYSVP